MFFCILQLIYCFQYNDVVFYSNGITRGRFSSDGITLSRSVNNSFVECSTNHLTSFAVLVDVSGESVSIIGCRLICGDIIGKCRTIYNLVNLCIGLCVSLILTCVKSNFCIYRRLN